MASKIDKSIRKAPDFKRIVRIAGGNVAKAHQDTGYVTTGLIKEFVESDLDVRICRDGKRDAVNHKHVVRMVIAEVETVKNARIAELKARIAELEARLEAKAGE